MRFRATTHVTTGADGSLAHRDPVQLVPWRVWDRNES